MAMTAKELKVELIRLRTMLPKDRIAALGLKSISGKKSEVFVKVAIAQKEVTRLGLDDGDEDAAVAVAPMEEVAHAEAHDEMDVEEVDEILRMRRVESGGSTSVLVKAKIYSLVQMNVLHICITYLISGTHF